MYTLQSVLINTATLSRMLSPNSLFKSSISHVLCSRLAQPITSYDSEKPANRLTAIELDDRVLNNLCHILKAKVIDLL